MELTGHPAQYRECIDLLIHMMRLHYRIVEKRIEGLGVHHSQHRMLMQLWRMDRSASQKDIAAAMDVSPACVARTLKPLHAAGLVEKSCGSDGRCNEISITPDGSRLVENSLELFRQIDMQMFRGVSGDALSMLRGTLGHVRDNLVEMEKAESGGGCRGEGSL